MKILLLVHSNSGHTRLSAEYLQRQLKSYSIEILELGLQPAGGLPEYDVLGLATWTYYLGLPPFFENQVRELPAGEGRPVFLLNTYGMMPGQALYRMMALARAQGYSPFAGFSLHTPESYPVFVAKGWGAADAPQPADWKNWQNGLVQLKTGLDKIQSGAELPAYAAKLGFWDHLMRPDSVQKARKKMGPLAVDAQRCTGCGTCQQVCRYGAVRVSGRPVFEPAACAACWACYNHCPQHAIFTPQLKDDGFITQPSPAFCEKMQE